MSSAQLLLGYVRKRAWVLIASVLISLIGHGLAISLGLVIGSAIERLLRPEPEVTNFAILVGVLGSLRAVCDHLGSFMAQRAGSHVIQDLRSDAMATLLGHEKAARDFGKAGELQTRVISDSQEVGLFVAGHVPKITVLVIAVISAMTLAVFSSPLLSGMVLAGVLVLFIPLIWINAALRNRGYLAQKADADAGRMSGEILRNIRVVAAFYQHFRS